MIKLSDEQRFIEKEILDWYRSPSRRNTVVKFAGYAGTGKTTVLSHISKKIRVNSNDMGTRGAHKIAFCAFTGKASVVLENKLEETGALRSYDYIGTIHGLLYFPETIIKNGRKVIVGWNKKKDLDCDLIVVDEGSMVTGDLWKDLLSYRVPIIVCGDHGQLPPVGSKFNLLLDPDYILKEIHRQALENPIVKLTLDIRRKGYIDPGVHGPNVFKLDWNNHPACQKTFNKIDWVQAVKNTIILCGFNKTRVNLNKVVRGKLDYKLEEPYPGERVICLQNNHETGVKNGQLGTAVWFYPERKRLYDLTVEMDGFEGDLYQCLCYQDAFGKPTYDQFMDFDYKTYMPILREKKIQRIDLFDFGYAITVHKSQGSEWDRVILFEQRNQYQSDQEYARWLYTAATRAKEKLFVIYNYWG